VRLVALVSLSILVALPAAGQQADPPRISLVAEYTLVGWIIPPRYPGFPAAAEVGPLVHVGNRHGVGWTLLLDVTHSDPFVGTGPRYRRWLGGRFALDAGASVPLTDFDWMEVVTQVGVSYADIVGLTTRVGLGGLDGFNLGLGARVGRGPGLAAGALTAMALVIGRVVLGIQWWGATGEM
jgi:hypothetical protein